MSHLEKKRKLENLVHQHEGAKNGLDKMIDAMVSQRENKQVSVEFISKLFIVCENCNESFLVSEDIGGGASKLNTFAQRCCQELVAGFESTIIRFIGLRLNH